MKLEDIRQSLRKLPLAKVLSPAVRERVVMAFLACGEVRRPPKGGVLINQGEPASDAGYVLLEGAVSVQRNEHPPICCGAPEILGEMQQFNPMHERTATVRAEEDALLLVFAWSDFFKAADAVMNEEERALLREELGGLAWKHFVDTDESV